MALRGFYFHKIQLNWPKKCEDSDDFSLKLLILLSKKNRLENGWEEFVAKCFKELSPAFKFQISYKRENFKRSAKLKSKIKKFLPPKRLSEVMEIYQVREKVYNQTDWGDTFINAMKLGFDSKENRIKIFRQNKEVLQIIETERKTFLSGILKIIIAMRSQNQAWAKKVIREFINMGPAEMIFYHRLGGNQDFKKIKEDFIKFLDKVQAFLKDTKWKNMFFNQLYILSSAGEKPFELEQWRANWSFQQIQNEFKSQNYGVPYLGFWYEMYNYNTFPAQVDRFMKEQLTGENIKNYGENFLWLFSYYFPEDEKAQEETLKIMGKLVKSKEMYHKYLIIRLLETLNEQKYFKVLNKIKKRYPKLSMPLFRQKRTFYKELLRKGEVLDFSVYQLLKLEDTNAEKDILWWVTF